MAGCQSRDSLTAKSFYLRPGSAPYTLAHGYRFRRPLKLAKQRNPELRRPGVDFDFV
ncbi:unnamed protein product [marine sediment metagenome]|uniref:Uncharacterized protein n=1 Tax=marine sediment metagenome TaxID=412755 RepID=X1RCZ8_9ZZZZ